MESFLEANIFKTKTFVLYGNLKDTIWCPDLMPRGENRLAISAKTGEGVPALLELIEKNLERGMHHARFLLPYSMGGQVEVLHTQARVLNVEYLSEGILVEAICDGTIYGRLRPYEQEG